MKPRLRCYLVLLSCLGIYSCEDRYDICEKSKLVEVKAGFYNNTGGADIIAQAPAFSLSVLGSSTSLYNQIPSVSKFSFSLNPSPDSAKYLVRISNTFPQDTLTVFYTTQVLFLSAECGNINTHTLSNIRSSNQTIDSVKLIRPSVTNVSEENIKIYF